MQARYADGTESPVTTLPGSDSMTPRSSAVTPVPTLNECALMLMGLLATGLGAHRLRGRMGLEWRSTKYS